jgi:pyruvate dehydrogenase E2 component (dihydrolipoamide acetyltransferase)
MPFKILMPALSPTMTEGNLVKWHKKVGDTVKAGDVLAEIETDKATMEVEAVDEGKLAKIFVPEGTEAVKVNTLIAVLLEEGEDESALKGLESKPAAAAPVAAAAPAPTAAAPAPTPQKPVETGGRVFATPLAKRIAEQQNLSLSVIPGSGPHGRIIKSDVEAAMTAGTSALKPQLSVMPSDDLFPPYEAVKLNNMRKVIARRLTEAKQTVPHFYLTVDCELDNLLEARASFNANLPKEEKISVNDIVIKAMAAAMRDVPEANASYAEDHIKIYQRVDISVAVAIEGGLVTPIIHDAQNKSLNTIAREMKDLAGRARAGKLRPEEFQGGTVSLSNLGMFGIKDFSAVINPPQGCILAVGAGEKRAVVTENDQIRVATVMTCTLSVDHRVVDGAVGAQFLKAFKNYIEHPVLMLL